MGIFRQCAGPVNPYLYSSEDYTDEQDILAGVRRWKPMLDEYAALYGLQSYENLLLAIMQAESGGRYADLMQSSESAGLEVNTLSEEQSVDQGCAYFRRLLDQSELSGTDLDCVIQAYNYGAGFLDYAAERGGVWSMDLAESFAREYSHGKTVAYTNPIAVKYNGGWRYAYGNMFYVPVVRSIWEQIDAEQQAQSDPQVQEDQPVQEDIQEQSGQAADQQDLANLWTLDQQGR